MTAVTAGICKSAAQALHRLTLPLAAYYAITLGIPILNGAARSGTAFLDHALVVLVVPPTIILLGCVLHTIVRAVVHSIGWIVGSFAIEDPDVVLIVISAAKLLRRAKTASLVYQFVTKGHRHLRI